MSNIFMSTENSKTSYSNRFRLYFTDKIDLRGNKKIALSDLSIPWTCYNIKNNTITINLDYLDQLGLKMLLYLMVVMKHLKYKTIFLMK